MDLPSGFADLVKAVTKAPPEKVRGPAIWDAFVRVIFLGGPRSDADAAFLVAMLKKTKLLDLDYASSIGGEKWRDETTAFLRERLARIADEDAQGIVESVLKDLFMLSASVKGAARFFREKQLIERIAEYTASPEKTAALVEEIVNSEDVTGVRYTKAIAWLHAIGRGEALAPPSRYVKDFVNKDIGPYYQFYDDDKYFMAKVQEVAAEMKVAVRDVAVAAFYYRALKSLLPPRSRQSKAFTPAIVLTFLRSRKMTLAALAAALGNNEEKAELMERLNDYMDKHA